jgi:hypothetical protein
LHEAALAHVEGFFAGEKALAEDGFGALEDDAAVVFGGVLEEQVFDETGVVELVHVAAEDAEVDQVAEVAGGHGHVLGGDAAEETAAEETWEEWRAGWIGFGGAGTDVDGNGDWRSDGCHAGLWLKFRRRGAVQEPDVGAERRESEWFALPLSCCDAD